MAGNTQGLEEIITPAKPTLCAPCKPPETTRGESRDRNLNKITDSQNQVKCEKNGAKQRVIPKDDITPLGTPPPTPTVHAPVNHQTPPVVKPWTQISSNVRKIK